MITKRQIEVLSLIIQLFGQFEEPVGSKRLLEFSNLAVSSATIRNDMVRLEREGLLNKSHISSGRIPSLAGYQFYINQLIEHPTQCEVIKQSSIVEQLMNNSRLDDVQIAKLSANLMASQTKLPTFILGQDETIHQFQEFKLILLEPTKVMAILITNAGEIENDVFNLNYAIDEDVTSSIENIINRELRELSLLDAYQRMKLVLPLIIQKNVGFQVDFSSLIEKTYTQLRQQRFKIFGKEFMHRLIDDTMDGEGIIALMKLMDGSHEIYNNLNTGPGIHVLFGSELESSLLKNITLLVGNYSNNQQKISIGIVGPMTMPYQRNISLLSEITSHLVNR